jgi:branched-chain amino acid transport system ATP-binding protein
VPSSHPRPALVLPIDGRPPVPTPLLQTRALRAGYGRKQVVHGVDLTVAPGEIVGLMGHNGAGKTTTIRTVIGALPPLGGEVRFGSDDVTGRPARSRIRAGMALIPSEQFVFPDLTVEDNLRLGAANAPADEDSSARREFVESVFPILAERRLQPAGQLSGGQQRMVSLGMTLMARPKLLLLDEPSLGLAPAVVDTIFGKLRELADAEQMGILLLEQNVKQALTICDRVYVLRSGAVILEETAAQMRGRADYWDLF